MSILDYLLKRRTKSAKLAKDRLQIILAREHADRVGPDYLPALKRDLLEVVGRYVVIDMENVTVNLDRDGECDILELNIALPDDAPQEAVR